MARDHRKLRVFHDAHRLVIAMYRHTRTFPRDEWFGTRAQLRRAAVSVSSNIVEGSARRTTREYLNFSNVARGSAGELSYLIELVGELGFLSGAALADSTAQAARLLPQMQRLVQSVEGQLLREEAASRRRDDGAQTGRARHEPTNGRVPKAKGPEPKA